MPEEVLRDFTENDRYFRNSAFCEPVRSVEQNAERELQVTIKVSRAPCKINSKCLLL